VIVDVRLGDAPAGLRGAQQEFQRVAEAAVVDRQAEQVGSAGGPHRPEVADGDAAPAQPLGDDRVTEPGVRRPGPHRGGPPAADHQIGAPGQQLGDEPGELRGIQRRVGVADADQLGARREQPRLHGRAISALRHVDDHCAALAGQLRRTVAGAVVRDDGAISGRYPVEDPGQRPGLVQAGENHVDRHRSGVALGKHDRDSSDGPPTSTLTE
jgi:hypothetical protein